MDIPNTTDNNTLNTTTSTIKTPEAESEAPTRIQSSSAKPLSFTNGLLKRNPYPHPITQTPSPQPTVYVYKECLKNHAANLGGHAVDGCGEFMPSPSATPTDPASLKCAACGCHRNFHRRFTEHQSQLTPTSRALIEYQPLHRHHPLPPDGAESPNSPSPPPISSAYYPASAPHMLLALSAGLSGQQPENSPAIGHGAAQIGHPNGRKRFRTKFTQNQKERMLEFAEKIGWKFQKRDEDVISEFCSEIGVDRGVLKVWMHNNKSTRCHRSEFNNSNNGGGKGGNHEINGNEINEKMRNDNENSSNESRENHGNGDGGPVNGGNASSSSS